MSVGSSGDESNDDGAKTPPGSPLRVGFAVEEEDGEESDDWAEGHESGLKAGRREGIQELLRAMVDYIASSG